jgi:kumamolisin
MLGLVTLPLTVFAAPPGVALIQSVVPLGRDTHVDGPAKPGEIMHFQIALRMRDSAGLASRLGRRERITPDELAQNYLPAAADHAAVVTWLRAAGMSVDRTYANHLTIETSGPVATVSRAFGVHVSRITSEGATYNSADSAPHVPAALAETVLSVNGLQPQLHAMKLHAIKSGGMAGPQAQGSPGSTPYIPSDLLNAYGASGVGSTGAGATTAIVIDTFPNQSDLTSFWSQAGISQSLSNIDFIQSVAGTLPAPSGEESLDTEWASSIAPSSQVRVYAAQSLAYSNLDTAFQNVISDLQAGVGIDEVSISLGACETSLPNGQANTDDNLFATIESLGATVLVSSGDGGSDECGNGTATPAFFSTSPNVTAVGGTTLNLDGNDNITSETGWSGSGGGLSTIFATPSWQSGLGYSARAVPDVASDADPNTGALVILNGQAQQYGGTSLAAPTWGGLLALANAGRIANGSASLGALNSTFYSLSGTANFNDITGGSNGAYSATTGYDLVTGLGSPGFGTLYQTLLSQ